MTLAEKMPQFDTEHALIDALLADIAVRVQLPASSHARAVDRYSTIRDWIDRDGSPLKGRVHLMYPQGSMATGTTISRHSEEEDFEIDIMVDLHGPPWLTLPDAIAMGRALEPYGLLFLEAPVERVTGYDLVLPFFNNELPYMPDVKKVVSATRKVLSF